MHALTVDLEEWFHGIELSQDCWPRHSRLRVGLDRLLALLDEHATKATFFVLGAVCERLPAVVGDIAGAGHEIACHGYAHEFVYRQTPKQFEQDVRRAVELIAAVVGAPPRGYRAPYFSVRSDSLWALEVLAGLGFAYDSSIFPVRNDRYGIPGADPEPHEIVTASGRLQEVPLTPLKLGPAHLPFSGGAYLRILPWAVQRTAWAVATRRGMQVVSYIHPWELDPDHPRIELRRRVAATHYARLHLTERRLRRLLSRYRFGRMDHVFSV